jgi:hypothetical protein
VWVETSSVVIHLPDILASLSLRWSETEEPATRPPTPTRRGPTALPKLGDWRRQNEDIRIHNLSIQFMVVELALERFALADAELADVFADLEGAGWRLRQRHAEAWDAKRIRNKRSDVKKTLGGAGYVSYQAFALDTNLPYGTVDGLAVAAERAARARFG